MAAGGGASERGSPPERDRRRPVTRPLLLWGPPHDPGGAGAGRAFQRGPEAARRANAPAAPRREEGGVWWPGKPAASRHREQPALAPPGLHGARPPPRPARRSPPPLQGAPCSSRLLGAVAALLRRARLGSSSVHSHPFAHLWLAQNSRRRRRRRLRRRSHGRRLTSLSHSAGSPASNARREAPPRPRPLERGLGWWAAPPSSPRVPAHCTASLASPPGPCGSSLSGPPSNAAQSRAWKRRGRSKC